MHFAINYSNSELQTPTYFNIYTHFVKFKTKTELVCCIWLLNLMKVCTYIKSPHIIYLHIFMAGQVKYFFLTY